MVYSRSFTLYATPFDDFFAHSWSCGEFWMHRAYENQWVMEDFDGALRQTQIFSNIRQQWKSDIYARSCIIADDVADIRHWITILNYSPRLSSWSAHFIKPVAPSQHCARKRSTMRRVTTS